MKKRNIIFAVATLVIASLGVANATTNLSSVVPDKVNYASEISGAFPQTMTLAGTNQDSSIITGQTLAAGSVVTGAYIVRVDLINGSFQAPPSALIAGTGSVPANTPKANTTATLISGGTPGTTTAFFSANLTTIAGVFAATDIFFLNQTDISATTKADVTVKIGFYANLPQATAQTFALQAAKSKAKIGFAPGLTSTSTVVTPGKIDVATNSTKFLPGATSTTLMNTIANPTVALVGSTLAKGGATVTLANLMTAYTMTVTGDFSATQILPATVPATFNVANVFIDANGGACNNVNTTAATLTATQATFNVFSNTVAPAAAIVCMVVNGTTAIAKGPYTVSFTPANVAGYTVATQTGLAASTLVKNGTTKNVFSIAPATSTTKKSFVRITNTSAQAGNLTITVTNDAGTALLTNKLVVVLQPGATYTLGGDPAVAGVGAAAEIETHAAFVPSVATPSLWTGKARIEIVGEFGSMSVHHLVNSAVGSPVQTNLTAVQ